MSLHELREEVIDMIQEELSVIASGLPVQSIGGAFERAADLFQTLGSCNLLLYMDTDRFRTNLAYSGYTRRYFLNRSRAEGSVESPFMAISRSEAFFDAVVSRHERLTAEIALLSPPEWIPDGEYEDDYCYHAFLHHLALDPRRTGRERLELLLERFEHTLEGAPSPRRDLCEALLYGQVEAFEEAFVVFLQAHGDWTERQKAHLQYDPTFRLRSLLSVEGLALLSIAERSGLPLPMREYAYCPSIARLAPTAVLPEDLYEEVDRIATQERYLRTTATD